MSTAWGVETADRASASLPGQPVFLTLQLAVEALKRRWWIWLGIAALGAGLGLGYSAYASSTPTATVTMLLAHPPETDDATAMATDVNLLDARPVAQQVIDQLRLTDSVDGFLTQVAAEPVTDQLLRVEVTGPDDAAAVERASKLAEVFLAFRGDQLVGQADAVVAGYRQRIATLQTQVTSLTQQYAELSTAGASSDEAASDVLTERARATGQISDLQQQLEQTSLDAGSVVAASSVVDPAVVPSVGVVRERVLPMASGLIGGLGVGIGLVIFLALTNDRLRRRVDVANALGLPVRYATGVIGPGLVHSGRARRDTETLVGALIPDVLGDKPSVRIIATVDAAKMTAEVVVALACRLGDTDTSVAVVDLGGSAALARRSYRRRLDASGVRVVAGHAETDPVPDLGVDVVVVFAVIDPGIGVQALMRWSHSAVLVVGSGLTSAERLRTTSESFAAVGPRLEYAVLVGADAIDSSSGRLADGDPIGEPG